MSTLKPKQILAATALASGKTAREVASEINCTPETISHWKNDPNFEAHLNQLKWDVLEAARDSLRSAATDASTTLHDLVKSGKSEETKRRACIDILNLTGLSDRQSGLYGWGAGKLDPDEIVEEREAEEIRKRMYRNYGI